MRPGALRPRSGSYAVTFDPFFRRAACFDTPSIVPISVQLGWACPMNIVTAGSSVSKLTNDVVKRGACPHP